MFLCASTMDDKIIYYISHTWVMMCWYFSGSAFTPKLKRLHRNIMAWVAKAVTSLDSASNAIWSNRHLKFNFENSAFPLRILNTSVISKGNLWQIMASLALRISTHNLMSPDAFGTITTGLTHVLSPSTLSMMSFSRSSFTLVVTLSFSEKGTRRIFWTTWVTLESVWYVVSRFPIP